MLKAFTIDLFSTTLRKVIYKCPNTGLNWENIKRDDLQGGIKDMLVDLRYRVRLRKNFQIASKIDTKYFVIFVENDNDL